jgi:hypothetical protein
MTIIYEKWGEVEGVEQREKPKRFILQAVYASFE